jgi:hypothetical protein
MKISNRKYRQINSQKVMVEIIAKQKGCMLCDLAIAILEEIAPEFEKKVLQWTVVDVSSREGVRRHAELGAICKRMPAVPSIVINERIAFDNIPDMEALSEAVRQTIYPDI